MRNLLLISSSRCHPHGYLDHCEEQVRQLFEGIDEIIFVPFARPSGMSLDAYTKTARDRFQLMDIDVTGLHQHADPKAALQSTGGVFIGGGNTFVLLRDLYQHGCLPVLQQRVRDGMPYMGTSAGSNVAGLTIGTSNDMPIVFPSSFNAIGAVPFNLNPHYPAAKPDPTHQGETRDDRIQEFHVFNDQPVISLHEDGMLRIQGDTGTLIGERPAYLFRAGEPRATIATGELPSELLL